MLVTQQSVQGIIISPSDAIFSQIWLNLANFFLELPIEQI